MKRNRFLLLLALLMTAATGAWAQGPTKVTKLTSEVIASWQGVNEAITADDLNKIGFESTDYSTASAWTGAPDGDALLFYKLDAEYLYGVYFMDGSLVGPNNISIPTKGQLYEQAVSYGLLHYTGAPAAPKHLIVASCSKDVKSMQQALPYETTIGELYEAVTGQDLSNWFHFFTLQGVSSNNTSAVSVGALNDGSTPVTVNAAGKASVSIQFDGGYPIIVYVDVVAPNYVTMADGVKDADKWTVKVGETGSFGALPIVRTEGRRHGGRDAEVRRPNEGEERDGYDRREAGC